MKKALLFFTVLALELCAYSQPTFEKYYLPGAATATSSLSEQFSGNLFTGMLSWATILDPQGNIIHTHYWDVNPMTNVQSVRKNTDNEIWFVAGYLHDSCTASGNLTIPYTDPVIGKMDSLGSILAMHRYTLNAVTCSNTALDLEITSDGGAIAWGRDDSFFALRVDSQGMPLWSRQFAHHGSFRFIRELPGGDLLAGFNMDTAGAVVARLGPAGNFLWCRSYIRPGGMVQGCVIESDSSFIITGYTDSIASTNGFEPLPADYDPKLYMMKLNGLGEVQWCKGYGSEPKWYARKGIQIRKTLDANYVVLANIGIPNYNLPYRPFFMKTDLNGDTLWTRSVGVNGYTYLTINLLAAADGGFYYDGGVDGDFGLSSSATYLFKTDSLGHLPCNERQHPVVVLDLFPTDSSFTLSSVDGAVAYPITVSDVTYDPIMVLEPCSTGFTDQLQPRKFKVYPNPSTGHFTVAFHDPLMAQSYYSVYDALGKLLYQRPLPPGQQTEEVDLSRFGKGTYVIKFTDKEGVCYERVLVE
jgi:Secretion system C-terminal sorting domain